MCYAAGVGNENRGQPVHCMSRGQRMLMLSLNKRLENMHSVHNDSKPTLIFSTGLRSLGEQLQHSGTQHVASTSRVDVSLPAETSSRKPHTSTVTLKKRRQQMLGAAAEQLKEKRALLLPADILVAATGSHSVEPSSVAADGQVSVSSDSGMSAPSPSFTSADEHTACSEGPTKKHPRTQAAQTANAKEKHPMLCPCSASCRRKCTQKISESRRSDIYTQYWQNRYDTRHTWMNSHIVRVQVQRRRPVPAGEASLANSRRPTCIRCRHAMGVTCLSAKHFFAHAWI